MPAANAKADPPMISIAFFPLIELMFFSLNNQPTKLKSKATYLIKLIKIHIF